MRNATSKQQHQHLRDLPDANHACIITPTHRRVLSSLNLNAQPVFGKVFKLPCPIPSPLTREHGTPPPKHNASTCRCPCACGLGRQSTHYRAARRLAVRRKERRVSSHCAWVIKHQSLHQHTAATAYEECPPTHTQQHSWCCQSQPRKVVRAAASFMLKAASCEDYLEIIEHGVAHKNTPPQ